MSYLEDNKGKIYKLGLVTVFGRKVGNHKFPQDKEMSGEHFKITRGQTKTTIEDLGSKNKTFLNRDDLEPFTDYELKEGYVIEAGGQVFKFVSNKKASF